MNTYGTVLRTEQVSPHLVRVVLGGPGLDGFVDPEHADSYVNAQFPTDEEGARSRDAAPCAGGTPRPAS